MCSAKLGNELAAVRFRGYEARDFPWLCQLDALCFAPGIAYTPEEIAGALLQFHTFGIVAEHDDEVVAFILAGRTRKSVGHIITIDVNPDWRGIGVGAQLMEMAETRLAAQGAERVLLEVSTANETAIAFYRRRGYGRERLIRGYYRDGSDAYRMEKAL